MIYFCAQKNRRELVLQAAGLNGIDYLEVLGPPGCGTQLAVTFLKPATSLTLDPTRNISITGGAAVRVGSVTPATAADPTLVIVNLDRTGDFSTYTFALVADPGSNDPPAGIDPQLASVDFSFKAGCPTPADCQPASCCPPAPANVPDINYLAKDYTGFLQVMLDRLAVLTPGWTETHAADLGNALTEVLAYAADHLSYQQDAVSTEAHLGTARSRISLRRHARLVDYRIGEGRNARSLVCLATKGATDPHGLTVPEGTLFYVRVPGLPPAVPADNPVAQQLTAGTQPVFTSMLDASLNDTLNEIHFYTWGDDDCCLPAGATGATLDASNGPLDMLKAGSFLIFEEVAGPLTGASADADPAHRCAVQLTSATSTKDPLNGKPVTRITWAPDDALPFPLCICTTESGAAPVSVARGNIVLADHGRLVPIPESLGVVPAAPPAPDPAATCTCGTSIQAAAAGPLPRYYPRLAQSPLTFWVPLDPLPASAAAFLAPAAAAVPDITLTDSFGSTWTPVPDLLSSPGAGPTSQVFVPEIEFDGSCSLRFGDDQHGMAPTTGLSFTAVYRSGNGAVGNIGRDTLGHAVVATKQLPAPSGLRVVGSSSGGTFAKGTYSWQVTATNANGETVASNQVSATLTGPTSSAALSWTQVPGATGYHVYRTSAGSKSARLATITSGSTVTYTDTGSPGTPATPPPVNTAVLLSPTDISHINQVRNPLPAVGGTDPEDMEHIRQFAPFAYEQQQRCVTEDDYGALAAQAGNVTAARATLRWTGSWYTVFASIQPAAVLPSQQLPAPSGLGVVASSSGGALAAGTYYWQVSATNDNGETAGSNEASATLKGTTSAAALSWTRVPAATWYKVYRGTSAGKENTLVATVPYGKTTTYTDTGFTGTPAKPSAINTATLPPLDTLITDTTTRLDMLRMMGTDVAVEAAVLVGLQIEMEICVDAQHFQGDVFEALTMVFIAGDQCDGSTGLLNPASFTFGQTVYASPLIAAAQAVEGVVSASLSTFTRMDAPWVDGVAQGYLTMGRVEIARCDNDPDHLDRGTFTPHLDGGK
jgi:hypothetical protein